MKGYSDVGRSCSQLESLQFKTCPGTNGRKIEIEILIVKFSTSLRTSSLSRSIKRQIRAKFLSDCEGFRLARIIPYKFRVENLDKAEPRQYWLEQHPGVISRKFIHLDVHLLHLLRLQSSSFENDCSAATSPGDCNFSKRVIDIFSIHSEDYHSLN